MVRVQDRLLYVGDIIDVQWDNEAVDWIVQKPIKVSWQAGTVSWHFEVPVGFHTDLASIPRAARSIIPQVGRQNRASIVHDFAYEDGVPGLSRKEADQMFLTIMKLDGVGWLRRKILWAAVRTFGGPLWGRAVGLVPPTQKGE